MFVYNDSNINVSLLSWKVIKSLKSNILPADSWIVCVQSKSNYYFKNFRYLS